MTGEAGLLDTNILILWNRLDGSQLPERAAISAVTLGELSAGPASATDAIERARRTETLQRAEAGFEPLPYDAEAARLFGRLWALVMAAGRNPRGRLADLMIASVAASNQMPLYTTNPADYAGVESVVTIKAVTHPDNL